MTKKPATQPIHLADLIGSVRRSPEGTRLAVLWPSPPHPSRWMVTDKWGSTGYEPDETVAAWPVVGAVPFSPAAGMELAPTEDVTEKPGKRWRLTDDHLDIVADIYAAACGAGEPPTKAVQNHFGVSHSTAAKWVGHARKQNHLASTTPGRGGA